MRFLPADLYSLKLRPIAQAAAGRGASPVRKIERQIARGFTTLRFSRGLEVDFCRYLQQSGRLSRISLVLISVLGLFLVMSIDRSVLGLPPELLWPTRAFQLGVMMPSALICGLWCLCWPESRVVDFMMLLLFVSMNVGMLGQRVVASRYGFDVPAEMVGVTVVAMFSMARIRFWLLLPAALVTTAGVILTEMLFVHADPNAYYHLFSAGLLLIIGIMGGYSFEYFIRWTWLNSILLRDMARLDSLTGLLNRQALETATDLARAQAERDGSGYAIAMIDVDAFGAYNDRYGHQAGDATLIRIAAALRKTVRRPLDVCGRYGGEEFLVLWMDVDVEQAHALAEKTRAAIERARIPHVASGVTPWVTATIGVCCVPPGQSADGTQQIVRQADERLYEGKALGRNQVVVARYDAAARPP